MASSRVADPPHQATVHDSSMNTDASAMQIKNHQLSSILDEFEQWATIVPNLSLDQRQEISEHLQEQISQLATFNEPNGTRKQQFIDLERLSKLQQGPLGKLVDYGGFLVIMDGVIRKRLQALSGKAVDVAPEVTDSTDSSRVSTPTSSVGTGLGKNADGDDKFIVAGTSTSAQSSNLSSGIKDQHKKSATSSNLDCFCEEWKPYYPLVAAIRKRSDEYAIIPDDHLVNVHLTINGPDVMILSGKHYPDVTFSREDVTSVQYDRDSGVLDVTLFDDGVSYTVPYMCIKTIMDYGVEEATALGTQKQANKA